MAFGFLFQEIRDQLSAPFQLEALGASVLVLVQEVERLTKAAYPSKNPDTRGAWKCLSGPRSGELFGLLASITTKDTSPEFCPLLQSRLLCNFMHLFGNL